MAARSRMRRRCAAAKGPAAVSKASAPNRSTAGKLVIEFVRGAHLHRQYGQAQSWRRGLHLTQIQDRGRKGRMVQHCDAGHTRGRLFEELQAFTRNRDLQRTAL